jgi:hypothetical protein
MADSIPPKTVSKNISPEKRASVRQSTWPRGGDRRLKLVRETAANLADQEGCVKHYAAEDHERRRRTEE